MMKDAETCALFENEPLHGSFHSWRRPWRRNFVRHILAEGET
jgi:hypothetical protein